MMESFCRIGVAKGVMEAENSGKPSSEFAVCSLTDLEALVFTDGPNPSTRPMETCTQRRRGAKLGGDPANLINST